MDRIDLYDEQKKVIRTCKYDKNCIPNGLFYYTVHVWIYSSGQGFLIQQRSRFVKRLPGQWTTTSGTVLHSETSLIAAQREVQEELGIKINAEELQLVYQYKKAQHFVDVFYIEKNIELNMLKLQEDEVENVKFSSNREIRNMVKRGEFYEYIYLSIFNI